MVEAGVEALEVALRAVDLLPGVLRALEGPACGLVRAVGGRERPGGCGQRLQLGGGDGAGSVPGGLGSRTGVDDGLVEDLEHPEIFVLVLLVEGVDGLLQVHGDLLVVLEPGVEALEVALRLVDLLLRVVALLLRVACLGVRLAGGRVGALRGALGGLGLRLRLSPSLSSSASTGS